MFKTVLLVLYIIARLYQAVLVFTIILSWAPGSSDYAVFRFVQAAGGCYLDVFRGKIVLFAFDFGTIIALGVYELIINFAFLL